MTMQFAANTVTPATGAVALYRWVTLLLANGFTKVKDSDGTTYSSMGATLSSGASGANGLGNASAWFVLEHSVSKRQWCVQRTTTNLLWRVKYSANVGGLTGFTGGTISATRVPSATDEVVLAGSGTDASPTGATCFGADGAYKFHAMVDDANGSWLWMTTALTTGTIGYRAFCDVMVADTSEPLDVDPSTHNWGGTNFDGLFSGSTTWAAASAMSGGWMAKGIAAPPSPVAGGAFVGINLHSLNSGGAPTFPSDTQVNPYNGFDASVRGIWLRGYVVSTPVGWKGLSTLFYMTGKYRSLLSTLNDNLGTKNRLIVQASSNYSHSIPWDGTDVPLV